MVRLINRECPLPVAIQNEGHFGGGGPAVGAVDPEWKITNKMKNNTRNILIVVKNIRNKCFKYLLFFVW
jgi:hypothetical protein